MEEKMGTKQENIVEFYPKIENVLTDISLNCYFRPLLTYNYNIDDKYYQIHLLCTDGLYCEGKIKYSESNFFGFDYNGGKYKFLGNIKCFMNYKIIPKLYDFLLKDFMEKKDDYLNNKVSTDTYLGSISDKICKLFPAKYSDSITDYAEAFYSYEFTKYYYEQTGKHKHISVVTENYGENEDDFLLSKNDALNILEEYFINLKYMQKNTYEITKEMFCCAVESSRFMSIIGGRLVFTLLDKNNDKVYLLEYTT